MEPIPSWHLTTSESPAVYNGQNHLCIMDGTPEQFGQIIADIETYVPTKTARLLVKAPALLQTLKDILNSGLNFDDLLDKKFYNNALQLIASIEA
jgi:hypothetical protein